MSYSTEQKYAFLLSMLEINDVCFWEKDAILTMDGNYFQFSDGQQSDKDAAIQWMMNDRGIK